MGLHYRAIPSKTYCSFFLFSNNSVSDNSVACNSVTYFDGVGGDGVVLFSSLSLVTARSERNSYNSYEHEC